MSHLRAPVIVATPDEACAPRSARARDADWRFLLPVPPSGRFNDLLLVGGSPELAATIIDLGVARTVTLGGAADNRADAVVVLHGAAVDLRAVARRVRPGGVLYLERSRLGATGSTLRNACRALAGGGLETVHTWAVLPRFDDRPTYLPLESPASFRWYLSTFRSSPTPGAALRDSGVRAALPVFARHMSALARSFALVALAGRRRWRGPSVLDTVASELGPDCSAPHTALLTRGGDRVVLLPFRRGERSPRAVVKIPRTAEFNERTENEHRVLTQLSRDAAGEVPAPLGLLRCGPLSVAVETFAPGTPILCSTGRWGATLAGQTADLRAAGRWLSAFHRDHELSRSAWRHQDIDRWIDQPCASYARQFGVTPEERNLFERARSYAYSLVGSSFPVVLQHRDYKPPHVLRRAASVTVIDWEGARPGPALCDLLHFILHWQAAARGVPGAECLARVFVDGLERDRLSRAVSETIAEYTSTVRLDRRFVPLLLAYTCIELALRRADQQQSLGEPGRSPRDGNPNFELIDVLARHPTELFAR